jgi:hypothetical protein
MMMLQPNQYPLALYAVFWAARIRGCVRRGRQPLLRGKEWFFDVHVQPGFYEGAGKKLLHQYWLRMLIPFAVDIPLAVAIFLRDRFSLIGWLVIGLAVLIHVNHLFSVDLAQRQARPYRADEPEQQQTRVGLLLTPRRLRDYTNPKVEWALAVGALLAFALLLRYYFVSAEHPDVRFVFGVPVLMVYIQLGFLLAKRIIIAWRTPVPQVQAAEFMATREETRRYYLRTCDWNRAVATVTLLFWPVLLTASVSERGQLFRFWFFAWLVGTVISGIWIEIRRHKLVKLALRMRPVNLPDLLKQSEMARWPVCYQPAAPMLVLKGARGYSINLANQFAYVGAAYLVGMAVLITALRLGH